MNIPVLNYHGIESSPKQYPWAAGERVYVLSALDFQTQIDKLSDRGFETLSLDHLPEALKGRREGKRIMLTFDDGHISHFDHAAPRLRGRGQKGLFFISAGLVGKPYQMDWRHLRELITMGMEIGSHGMDHRPLVNLSNQALEREISGSKSRIEDALGTACVSFSIPRGFFNNRILTAAKKAGYQFMFTSRFDMNREGTDLMRLNRIAIKRGDNLENFERWMEGQLGIKRVVENVKEHARTLLPPAFYQSLARMKEAVRT